MKFEKNSVFKNKLKQDFYLNKNHNLLKINNL